MMLPVGLLPPDGRSCSSDSAVTDLPEPDSPTSARVSPRSRLNDTPSTTRLAPKATDRFSTSTRLICACGGRVHHKDRKTLRICSKISAPSAQWLPPHRQGRRSMPRQSPGGGGGRAIQVVPLLWLKRRGWGG